MKPKKTKEEKINEMDSSTIRKILKDSIEQYKDVVDRQNRVHDKDCSKLEGILSEYLDDYLIIGHTPDEKRVVIRYTTSVKDHDALNELVKQVCFRIMSENEKGFENDNE